MPYRGPLLLQQPQRVEAENLRRLGRSLLQHFSISWLRAGGRRTAGVSFGVIFKEAVSSNYLRIESLNCAKRAGGTQTTLGVEVLVIKRTFPSELSHFPIHKRKSFVGPNYSYIAYVRSKKDAEVPT